MADDDETTRLRDQVVALKAEVERLRQTGQNAVLSARERRLRDTLESMGDAFVLIDSDWRVVDLNQNACAIDGRPASQIVGHDLFELWPGTRDTIIETTYRRCMAERIPAALRHRYVDGLRAVWLDIRVFPSGSGLAVFYRDVSAEKEAEQRLRDAEVNARLSVDAARMGTWSYEPQTGELVWDGRHREIFGIQPGEKVDYPTLLLGVHDDDRARVEAAVAQAVDPLGAGKLAIEYRCVRFDDASVRWLAAAGRALFSEGVCTRIVGVVQDVTESRQAAAELAESESRFRGITEATPMIVFVADVDGRNTYTNPQFSELTGLAPRCLLDAGWLDTLHPDDRGRAAETWAAAVGSGGPYEIELRFRHHEGRYCWHLVRGMPIRDAGGRIARWFGTAMDISELVEARQVLTRDRDELERLVDDRTAALGSTLARLREEESRLRAIFENSSECLFLLRVEPGRGPAFLDVNGPALDVLGRSRAEVIGRTPVELIGEGAIVRDIEENLNQALQAGGRPHRYLARRQYSGQPRELDAVAVALDGPGEERLILITARDVTEQRALEEALRQSQKMEAVGQLTGGIAHDFNNLLTGISGSLELMQTRVAQGRPESVERYATAAIGSVHRAAALTHRLLAFARRQALDPRPADLNQLIGGMKELIRRTAGPAIEVRTVLAPDLWPTLCDANQLENALLNLCINAHDAMSDGGLLVIETTNAVLDEDVHAGQADTQPGEYAAVFVSDTGAGMPAEVMARAFEPFFTTKPIGQGTGLGLSMLYGFVRQSGGHVRIESEVGRGSIVRLYLPRSAEAEPAGAGLESPAGQRADGRKTVLIVEDEAVVRMLAMEVVQGMGYLALEAGDGPAALEAMRAYGPIDLLLSDVGLPGMNGRQVAEAARQVQPGIPVLFMTGYAHSAAIGNTLLGPGMEILSKPFGLSALETRLRAMLGD